MTDSNIQQTLVILKPDAVQRAIAGELLTRFEKRGLRIAALRLLSVERALAETHYAVHAGKFFYDDLVSTITASPVIAAVLEGPNAIAVVRSMVGATTRSLVSAISSTRAMPRRPPRPRSRFGLPMVW